MGREVRRVPATWKHPRDARGSYIPLYGRSFSERLREWNEGNVKWSEGFRRDWGTDEWKPLEDEYRGMSFAEWDEDQPKPEDYMPDWSEAERTHYMMYETTTEGTPISLVFATPEELAHWLADTGASAFADQSASYEQWLRVCHGGYAPSAAMIDGKMMSGVAALSEQD